MACLWLSRSEATAGPIWDDQQNPFDDQNGYSFADSVLARYNSFNMLNPYFGTRRSSQTQLATETSTNPTGTYGDNSVAPFNVSLFNGFATTAFVTGAPKTYDSVSAAATADARWTGNGGSDAWTDDNNWQSQNNPTATSTTNTYYGNLASGKKTFTDMSGYGSFFSTGRFLFDATTTQYNIGGTGTNNVKIWGGVENGPTYVAAATSQPTQTVSANLALGGTSAGQNTVNFIARNGDLVFNGSIFGNAQTLNLNSGGASGRTITLNGALQNGADFGGGLAVTVDTVKAIFAGTNTYNGTVTIQNAGTLQIGNGGTSGTLGTGNVINNAALTFNRSDALSIGNDISGSGNVAQNGAGTTILSGTNSYAGTTTVNAGTLEAMKTASLPGYNTSGKVSVVSGGTVAVAAGGAGQWLSADIDVLRANASFASGSFLGIDTAGGSFTYNSVMANNFGLTKLGSNTLTLGAANTYAGATNVLNGTLQLGVANALPTGTTLTLGSTGNGAVLDLNGKNQQLAGLVATGTAASQAVNNTTTTAATLTLNISSGTNTFGGLIGATSTPDVRRIAVVKDGAGTLVLTNNGSNYDQGTTINAGTISISAFGGLGSTSASNDLTLNGGTLQITGSTSLSSSGRDIFLLSGGGTFDVTSGTTEINGSVTGAGGLTKTGVGTLQFSGANSDNNYAGTTLVSAGALNIQSATGLGTTAAGTSVSSGAALQLEGNVAIGSEALTLNGQGQANNGALRSVAGNNSHGGAITLASAARIHSSSGSNLSLTGGINNGGFRLTLSGSGNTTVGTNGISGSGDLLKQDSGTLSLNVASTFGGGASNVFIDQGTVSIGATGALGTTNGSTTGLINMGALGDAGLSTSLLLSASGITLNNPIDVRFLQTGAKTIGGSFTSDKSTFAGNIILHDNVTLAAANGGTVAFTGVISKDSSGTNASAPTGGFGTGPGVIINSGSNSTGIVEYANAMTYTGDTVVNSGTLQFNGPGSLLNSTIRLGHLGASTLNLISPTGSSLDVTVNVRPSSGLKTISASNTSGTSTLAGHFALDDNVTVLEQSATGTLAITEARAASDSTSTATDIKNHVLTFDGAGNIVVGTATTTHGTIYNSVAGGSIVKNGAGTLTLNDRSTYSGGTTVNGGTLLVNNSAGSATGGGGVTVNNSGTTLGGNGIITGPVTVNSGANLSPGNSPGTLTTGALTLANNSNFVLDLVNTTAGSGYDQLFVNGTVQIGGSNIVLNIGGPLNINDKFFVLVNDGTDTNNGTFSQGAAFTSGDYVFAINYLDNFGATGPGNDISLTVTAVPEPSTWATAILVALALGYMNRERFSVFLRRNA